MNDVDQAVAHVACASYGRLVAYLAASAGDVAAAEDALSDAFVAALRSWPERGVPARPDTWMLTVARRSLIGTHRRRMTAEAAIPALERLHSASLDAGTTEQSAIPDKRLELLYACAHPAIDRSLHAPLMLQVVLRLDAVRIAAAFLVPPATLGQQLVRAKRKIRAARIPFTLPMSTDLPERTGAVLDAIYAAYSTGWDDPFGLDTRRNGLVDEAVRLAELVSELLPGHPEAHGLAALLLHSRARTNARRGDDGSLIPLLDQDAQRWSRDDVFRAEDHLTVAMRRGVLGPYQLHAAIQSVHNRRALTGTVDWAAITALYRGLLALTPAVGVAVATAAALLESEGPIAAAAVLDAIPDHVREHYQPYWAVNAETLRRRGDPTWPAAAERANALAGDEATRDLLHRRFHSS